MLLTCRWCLCHVQEADGELAATSLEDAPRRLRCVVASFSRLAYGTPEGGNSLALD